MENNLTRWDFRAEIMKLPAKCKRLTSKTSRVKADELFYKYFDLILYDKETLTRASEEIKRLENIIESLKTGKVKYKGGFFVISEISSTKLEEDAFYITFKNGEKMSFDNQFKWVNDLIIK